MLYMSASGLFVQVACLCLFACVDGRQVTMYVDVYTGDLNYAGTGAKVYINLHGKDDSTGTLLVDASGDIEWGSHHQYTLTADYVGTPTYLTIWHDNSGWFAGWYLDRISITILGNYYNFDCYKWLDDDDRWKNLYPTECGGLPTAPTGGTWNAEASPHVVHETAELRCNSSYVRSTTVDSLATITCQPTGYWSNTRATCSKLQPVNGGWGAWYALHECSVTCGGGTRRRQRACNNPRPLHGGQYCVGDAVETQNCSMVDCPNWTPWFIGQCSATCGTGTRQDMRTCSSGHVEDCPGSPNKTESCTAVPCPVDGGWGSWELWGTCSQSCENGFRSRVRVCDSPVPAHGGNGCHGNSTDDGACNTQDCPHWEPYVGSGSCSVTCGKGVEQLTRNCSTGNVHDCPGSPYDEKPCETPACLLPVIG